MKYDNPKTNEWVRPVMKNYKISCCDCGLVHVFDFRIIGKYVEYRAKRDNRSTGQIRRWKEIKGEVRIICQQH